MSRARLAVRQGRRSIHREMAVPALYIAVAGAVPLPCSVRVHDRFEMMGNLPGAQGFGERQEVAPRLVFLRDEVPPILRDNAVVSVEAGEAYRIVKAHPAHDITITADVTRLDADDAEGLPLPKHTDPVETSDEAELTWQESTW